MHPLLKKQDSLHREATELLEGILYPICNKFGQIELVGSYVYKLLNHPDIDIHILNSKLTKKTYVELCAELLSLDSVSGLKTKDRVNYPHSHDIGHPSGYWVAPEIHFRGILWSIDIWLQEPDWFTNQPAPYTEKLIHLDEQKRIAVLSLKEELTQQGIYGVGKEFVSVDVYDAVINESSATIQDLREYKATEEGKLNKES